jgi:hypothetical protein
MNRSTLISIGHLIVLPIILYGAFLSVQGYRGTFSKGLNFVIIGLVGAGIIIHLSKVI